MNGIKLQLWATWLFYVVLIDLADEVLKDTPPRHEVSPLGHIADELALPFESISVEMVFRGIYHFTQAVHRGVADNLVAYLTARENRDLGVVKTPRPKRQKPPLDFSPFPQPQVLTTCTFS